MSPKGAYPSYSRSTRNIRCLVRDSAAKFAQHGLIACASRLRALGGFLGIDGSLLTHGGKNDNVCCLSVAHSPNRERSRLTGVLLVFLEKLVDLLANLTVRELDVVLGVALVVHKRKEAVLGNVELERNQRHSTTLVTSDGLRAGTPYG